MKNILSSILLIIILAMQACSQQTAISQFTGKTWHILKEEMNGIGTHIPLPGNTTLTIHNDNTWSCSSAIDGFKTGSWVSNANGKIKIRIGENNAVLSFTNDGRLKMTQKRLLAGKTFYWAVK
jgi:hypothetical protein